MANWYIDNEIAVPGDGSSPALAADDLRDVLDNVAFANGDNIYIKANTTHYTDVRMFRSFNVFTPAVTENITIDRYPTDTGTSRPIIDRGVTDSWIWAFGLNDDITIRNIHFVGSTDPVPPTDGMIAFSFGACNNITFEYCIFECNNHLEIFDFISGKVDNITMRYCHFVSTDGTVTHNILKASVAAHIGSATIEHCLFEKFKTTFYMNYNDAGETVTIDHNTFIECGGDGGEIFNLGTILDADFIATNNIFDGSSSVSVSNVFRFPSPNAGSLDEDYSDYYLFDNNYVGVGAITHVPGVNNIAINPGWVGGADTWEDAHIALTEYFAPLNTNFDMVEGDSGGGCLGAIFVAPYVPPVPIDPQPITLSYPINQDGTSFSCVNNALFTRIKSHLVDDNIYDTSPSAVGITDRTVTFSGSVGDTGATLLTAYQIFMGETQEVATITPEANGSYRYTVRLPHGRAAYYTQSSDGAYTSNQIHINSYNIHVWLCAYAIELLTTRNDTEAARQNAYIEDGTDFSGNAIQTDGYHLARNFGQFISANKLETMTRAEYQQMLIDVLEAYNLGPSVEAIDLICRIFTDVIPSYEWYRNMVTAFPPADTTINLRVISPPSLNYEWDDTEVYLYDRRWSIPAGSGIVLGGADTYIFVDGTSPVGIDNELTMMASAVAPERYTMNWIDTISSGLVQIDTYGRHTNISGELYVTTSRHPELLNGVSGTTADMISGIPGASIILNTSHVDLNIAQDTIDKTTAFGDVTIDYATNYEYILFGEIQAGASEITGIIDCGRIDGSGAVSRDADVQHHCGELRIHDSLALSNEARADLFQTLKDVKPAHKFFHILMENAVTAELEYYGTI